MEEAAGKEQGESWSLGSREDQSFEKGPLTRWEASSPWGGIWLILLTLEGQLREAKPGNGLNL